MAKLNTRRLGSRLLQLFVLALVIGITWYLYEDYTNTSSAQQLTPEVTENKVIENKDGTMVQGAIEVAPRKDNKPLIVPAE